MQAVQSEVRASGALKRGANGVPGVQKRGPCAVDILVRVHFQGRQRRNDRIVDGRMQRLFRRRLFALPRITILIY